MSNAYLPMVLTVMGGVLYHVAQKSVPHQANPFAAIIIAYFVGIAVCLLALQFKLTAQSVSFAWRDWHWAMVVMGLGAAFIEIGFLLVYRAGWNLSAASVIVNISVALLLIPLGVVLFRERLSWSNLFGIAFCLLGLLLLARK